MSKLTFFSEKEFRALGIGADDIKILKELRARTGRIDTAALAEFPSGIKKKALDVLLEVARDGEEIERQLTWLRLMLTPTPISSELEPATLIIDYHDEIDRKQERHSQPVTLRGPEAVEIAGVNPAYAITFTVISASEQVLLERTIAPAEDFQESYQWLVRPALGPMEHLALDGSIYARFHIPTQPREAPVSSPDTQIHRTGYFQVLGQPDFRFDPYRLMVTFPDEQVIAELSHLFTDSSRAWQQYFNPVDPQLRHYQEILRFEPASLDFDGMFDIGPLSRPGVRAPGWVWMLSGPDVVIGFEPDTNLYAPRSDVALLLPGGRMASTSGDVPFNVTEKGLLERPELFGDDPGSNCRPFDNPNRILSERRFYTALRVTQPNVAEALLQPHAPDDPTQRLVDFPRRSVNAERDIDYEPTGEVAKYQAKTVSLGHIIEMAVRYRSNGYSLGDIVYSLTLAPRQKRRIVKLDYERKESATRVEDTLSEDEVSDTLEHARDYDNAVSASLDEWARGQSKSSTKAGAVGLGFASPGFVFGGGAAASSSSSSSSQQGGRYAAASETQALRDAIRRWGESARSLQSTVITEMEQSESTQGVSEVVQNINYTRSLSVIYYEILRHLRIDTEVADVSECVFVPLPVREFTEQRIRRHREVLRRYARGVWERLAFQHLDYLDNNLQAKIPPGSRAEQELTYLSGSIWIRIALTLPGEGEIADAISSATDKAITTEHVWSILQKEFGRYGRFITIPISQFLTQRFAASNEERNRYFQSEIAPGMARQYINQLVLLDKQKRLIPADLTMAGAYRFGALTRVDFTVSLADHRITRNDLSEVTARFSDDFMAMGDSGSAATLPEHSFMNVVSAAIRYGNSHYESSAKSSSGERDLVNSANGTGDPDGALLTFRLSKEDQVDAHKEIKQAFENFKARLNSRPFFYHKAIWWSLDRDELFTLLDGYAISDNDPRSLASVVQRESLGIVGNSLVFRTSSDKPLDPMFNSFHDLKNHYIAGLRPADPMRISLPTQGVYARAHLDGCVAAEEHNGSFDWVFDNVEPELADLPSSIFDSRRSEPAGLAPTAFPNPIINLQNAPAAPDVSGLAGVLGAVQNAEAFRDMAGLSGTQANTIAGLQAAAGLAGSFGNMAHQSTLAQIAADAKAGTNLKAMMDALQKGVDTGLFTADEAKAKALDMATRLTQDKDEAERKHQQEIEREALSGSGGGEVSETTKDGSRTAKKNPDVLAEPKPSAPKPWQEYVKWLNEYEVLFYNFTVGDQQATLQPQHFEALSKISRQIGSVEDIEWVEGRASSTQAKTGDPERINEQLSQSRMEKVWVELLKYALDGRSDVDREKWKSSHDPVRLKYAEKLATIPEGSGGEDPVERSVLVRLARKVEPDPEKIKIPYCTEAVLYGQTILLFNNAMTLMHQNNEWMQINEVTKNITKINNGDVIHQNTHVEIKDNNITFIFNNNSKLEVAPPTGPGKNPAADAEYETTLWNVEIKNPKVTGHGGTEMLQIVELILNVVEGIKGSTPINRLGIDITKILDVVNKNSNFTGTLLSQVFSELFKIVNEKDSPLGNLIRALVIGNHQVDLTVHARPKDAPDNTELWQERHCKFSGRGISYRPKAAVDQGTIEGIKNFLFETQEPFKISGWGRLDQTRHVSLTYHKNLDLTVLSRSASTLASIVQDIGRLMSVIPGTNTNKSKWEEELEEFLHILNYIANADQDEFIFKLGTQPEFSSSDVDYPYLLPTLFWLQKGSLVG